MSVPIQVEGPVCEQELKCGNLTPAISLLDPSAAQAGGGAFTLTVMGSGFVEESVVRWNGLNRTTSFRGSHQLTALILASDLASAGQATVTVFNPAPGGGESSAQVFSIQSGGVELSGLSPSTVTEGARGFSLTLQGSNFTPRTVVLWEGSSRTTIFHSSSQLEAHIPTADVLTTGTRQVSVSTAGTVGSCVSTQVPNCQLTVTANTAAPVLRAIIPKTISTRGGTAIRILGDNFTAGLFKTEGNSASFYDSQGRLRPQSSESAQLKIGGVAATKITFINSQELKAEAPANSVGSSSASLEIPDQPSQQVSGPAYKELPAAAPVTGTIKRLRIPFVVDSSQFRTNLGVNNLEGQTATVTLRLMDNSGGEVSTPGTQVTVPPYGMLQVNNIGRYLENASEVTGREGSLILESEQQVKAWASQIDNLTEDPSMERSLAEAEASQKVVIPSSAKISVYLTSLIVINQSPVDGQVSLRSRSNGGLVQAQLLNQAIKANGFLHFEDFYGELGVSNVYGPIEVEAQGGIQVMATARIYTKEGTSGYFQGVAPAQASKKVIMPFTVDNKDFRTNLGLTNPGATVPGVLVSLVDGNGLTRGSLTTTIPAYGMKQINKINEALITASGAEDLEEGYLVLEADGPIVGWTSQIDNLTQDFSIVVGKPADTTDTKLLIPSTASTGSFTSTFAAVNLSDLANTVEIRSRENGGTVRGSVRLTIPPKGMISYGDILASFGQAGTYGPLEIESLDSRPILAVSRVSSRNRTGGYFQGVSY